MTGNLGTAYTITCYLGIGPMRWLSRNVLMGTVNYHSRCSFRGGGGVCIKQLRTLTLDIITADGSPRS